jgi:hydroxymethylglutaryl-CoA synthase
MTGIASYGFYIPKFRISVDEIANTWSKDPQTYKNSLKVEEKAVACVDEDSLTMGYEASYMAFTKAGFDKGSKKEDIKSIFFGTESPPYAVNPASTILGEYLGLSGNYLAYDTQFACKAGTGALVTANGLVKSGYGKYALVCASDKATGKPNDALEFTAAAGAVSLIIGDVGEQDLVAKIVDTESYSTDTLDFWRRDNYKYPSHAGRFTGEPAYFKHIQKASQILLQKHSLTPKDFEYAVFHMPNGKFPMSVAKNLGFGKDQLKKSLVSPILGNSYTACSLMGLVSVLEEARPGQKIFFCSYGSGAGSDAFIFEVCQGIDKLRQDFSTAINNKKYLSYVQYQQAMGIS